MPPESSYGYRLYSSSASLRPASPMASMARFLRSIFGIPRTVRASSTCLPILQSGSKVVIGSWNTTPTSCPRILRRSSSLQENISRPSSRMLPSSSAFPRGIRPLTHIAVTVFPLPLSPTMPSVSPLFRENETPFTAYRSGAAL